MKKERQVWGIPAKEGILGGVNMLLGVMFLGPIGMQKQEVPGLKLGIPGTELHWWELCRAVTEVHRVRAKHKAY